VLCINGGARVQARTSMRLSRARSFLSVSTHMLCSSSTDSLAMDAGTLAPALPPGLTLAMVL